ncbi:hypothetical protein [Geobacter sp.]|uniref:hypothetical protein n=1 Tax=Geobacter sp. TaxID=46610 RepID=UPI0026205BF1|nr:hypothetical protein [Geobacter sp.]
MEPKQILNALEDHLGAENGISAEKLAMKITGEPTPNPGAERKLRSHIADLRMHGVRICGHPSTGYYLAKTAEDIEHTCEYLHTRAMTSLVQISRLRNIALPELLGQLKLAAEVTNA